MKLRSAFSIALVVALSAFTAYAHAVEWSGTMSCGELQNAPNVKSRDPFVGNVTLRINEGTAVLDRHGPRSRDHLQGTVERGSPLMLQGKGWFHSDERNSWKVRAELLELGSRFVGTAVIESHDGTTKYRDCTVSIEAQVAESSLTANTPSPPSTVDIDRKAQAKIPKTETLVPLPPFARVVDQSSTLSEGQRVALETKLSTIDHDGDREMAVVIVGSTIPEDIETYATRLGNAWKVGSRKAGKGVLIVVAKDDRKIRIEVSKKLTAELSDATAKEIIDKYLTPAFRAGNYAIGLNNAIDKLSGVGRQSAESSSTSTPAAAAVDPRIESASQPDVVASEVSPTPPISQPLSASVSILALAPSPEAVTASSAASAATLNQGNATISGSVGVGAVLLSGFGGAVIAILGFLGFRRFEKYRSSKERQKQAADVLASIDASRSLSASASAGVGFGSERIETLEIDHPSASPNGRSSSSTAPVASRQAVDKGLSPTVKYGGGLLIAVVVLGIVGKIWPSPKEELFGTHSNPKSVTDSRLDQKSTNSPPASIVGTSETVDAPLPGEFLQVPIAERQALDNYLESMVSSGAALVGVEKPEGEPIAFAGFSNGWLEWNKPGSTAAFSRGVATIFTSPDRTCVGFEQEDRFAMMMDPRGLWKKGDPPLIEQYLVCVAVREINEAPFLAQKFDVFMVRTGSRNSALYLHVRKTP